MFTDLITKFFLNPIILAGIAAGVYLMHYYGLNNIDLIIYNKPALLMPLALSVLYAVIFARIYYPDSNRINWTSTLLRTFIHLLKFLFVTACTCFIIYGVEHYISFDKFDAYLRNKKTINREEVIERL